MPIYEYNCPKCGSFDAIQGVNENPLKAKPECTDKKCPCKAERVMSAAAFHLKGGGWYKDGYAGAAPAADTTKADSSSSDTPQSNDTKSSSKDSGEAKALKSRAAADSSAGSAGGTGKCGGGCKCH